MSYTNINDINNIVGKKVLFFDLETTGLIKTPYGMRPENEYPDYKSKIYDNVRIVSIGWLYMENFDYDYEIGLENIGEKIVKPDNFIIPEDSIRIHGITQDIANKTGIVIKKALKKIIDGIKDCDYIIGYNVFFDVNILLSELYRIESSNIIDKILELKKIQKILCVGILSSIYVQPDGWKLIPRNTYQISKQKHVYNKCFGKYPENIHNAKSDVLAMVNIIHWIHENIIICAKKVLYARHGLGWCDKEKEELLDLIKQNNSIEQISQKHERTEGAIYSKLEEIAGEMKYQGISEDEISKTLKFLPQEMIDRGILRHKGKQLKKTSDTHKIIMDMEYVKY